MTSRQDGLFETLQRREYKGAASDRQKMKGTEKKLVFFSLLKLSVKCDEARTEKARII